MASNVHVYPSDRFFHLGLEMAGFSHAMIENTCLNTNLERFSSFFFASPETCEHVYRDIQDESIEGCIGLKDPKPERFLLALYFLKKYPTKQELAAFLKMTEKTALNWAHTYVEAIRSLKDEKVSRPDSKYIELNVSLFLTALFGKLRFVTCRSSGFSPTTTRGSHPRFLALVATAFIVPSKNRATNQAQNGTVRNLTAQDLLTSSPPHCGRTKLFRLMAHSQLAITTQ